MAFFSLSLKDINMLKTRQQPSYKRIVSLLENPKALMASLLIAGTIVNIGIILISNLLLDQWIYALDLHPAINFAIKVVAITIVLVLFCQVLPKVWAAHHKIWFASTASLIVEIFNNLLYKISVRLVAFNVSVEKAFQSKNKLKDDSQLDDAIDLLPDNKASSEEKQILKGIRKFSNTTVKQTMRPRLDVSGIEASVPWNTLLNKVKELFKFNLEKINSILNFL